MRYSVKNKEEGQKVKEVLKILAEEFPYVTEGDVMNAMGYIPAPEAHGYGWPSKHILNGKIQVRKVKDTWFLYIFGEPVEIVEETEETKDDVNMFSTGDAICPGFPAEHPMATQLAVRLCRVTSKSKGVTTEEYGYFHRWSHNIAPIKDKGIVEQELAIVEMTDGTVRQVKPTNIIFGWED